MSGNIDGEVSEIVKRANSWIMKIHDKKKYRLIKIQKKVEQRANILLSAVLVVLMTKKLQNVFIDILEEHLIYNDSYSAEAKKQIQKRIMDFTIKTDIVNRITFQIEEIEKYKTQEGLSQNIKYILDELVTKTCNILSAEENARTNYLNNKFVEQIVDLINSNTSYPADVRERLRNALYKTFAGLDTNEPYKILEKLISEIRLEYPDLPYPEWFLNALITYEKS